ncbi:MAG: hypothetical protein GX579_08270 [Chloroflexi bacterium]|nr:hypothetical protein [Chloroflexota bacterium]
MSSHGAASTEGQADLEALRQAYLAEPAVVADGRAYALLRAFIGFQGELRQRQIQGTFTGADLEHLGQLQADVQANAVIAEFFRAQQEVTLYVQEINRKISSLRGLDFAGLARVAGCC